MEVLEMEEEAASAAAAAALVGEWPTTRTAACSRHLPLIVEKRPPDELFTLLLSSFFLCLSLSPHLSRSLAHWPLSYDQWYVRLFYFFLTISTVYGLFFILKVVFWLKFLAVYRSEKWKRRHNCRHIKLMQKRKTVGKIHWKSIWPNA